MTEAHTHTRARIRAYLHNAVSASYLHTQLAYTPLSSRRARMSQRHAANRTHSLSHTVQ